MNNFGEHRLEWPGWLLLPVVIGYLTMTRSFAHVGMPPLYIGEATLGLLLLARPDMILGTWLRGQLRPNAYTTLALLSAVFVAYGFIQCLRGLEEGTFPKISVQNFAFNLYVGFLFAGMWLGERHPDLLRRTVWFLAWANGLYGILYLFVFGQFGTTAELHTDAVQIFGQPAGSAIALLALLAFERDFRTSAIPMLLNGFVLLGMQVRAEWLAFAVAVAVLTVLTGRASRLLQVAGLIAGLLIVGVIVDFRLPAPKLRGGTISSREIVGRAIAAVDKDAASGFTANAQVYSDTVTWRTEWWRNLLEVTHKDPVTTLFGMGYGYPIWLHNEFDQDVNPTPHNIFIYVLTYSGWVGVLVFYSLQLCLAMHLWKGYRASGQAFGLCLWILMIVWAHFDNRLETPYGAIPFYVLVGMALTSATVAMTDWKTAGQGSASLRKELSSGDTLGKRDQTAIARSRRVPRNE